MIFPKMKKPVARSLMILWEHPVGDLSHEYIAAAESVPEMSLVDELGMEIDVADAGYSVEDVYGISSIEDEKGRVYWSNAIFNNLYLNWPAGITEEQKEEVKSHLKQKYIIIKSAS